MLNKFLGFTLIEVLISLSIISIALTAIMKNSTSTTRDNMYLDGKIIGQYVGVEVSHELEAGLLTIPKNGLRMVITAMNKKFLIHAEKMESPNKHISLVKVNVRDEDKKPITQLTSYLYEK